MEWDSLQAPEWPGTIENRPAKEKIAGHLAGRAEDGQVIGVGSGSTSFLALVALADRVRRESLSVSCIVTSIEVEAFCTELGLLVTSLMNSRPDWCFDGADEIDPDKNMIKGRGGAFLREKLVFAAAGRRVIVADPSKVVSRLGIRHPVPLAVVPEATNLVRALLRQKLGVAPEVRMATGKDGGVISEEGLSILDLAVDGSIPPPDLEGLLLATPGILATGLFVGYDFEILS